MIPDGKMKHKERDLFFKKIASTASKEISNALSELIGEKIPEEFCRVNYVEVKEKTVVVGVNEECFGVYSTISQPIDGVAVVFFPLSSISKLLDLVKRKYRRKTLSHEMKLSAFKEIGHIIISRYLGVFRDLLNTEIHSSPPTIAYFSSMTFNKIISSETTSEASNLLLMGKFRGSSKIVDGKLMLFFNVPSLDKLLKNSSMLARNLKSG